MEDPDSVSDDFIVSCSDDELGSSKEFASSWEPSPEEIISMYEMLESKGVLDFEWQCPGRRSPSINSIKSDLMEKGSISDDDSNKQVEPNEFDFKDEFSVEQPSPKISQRRRVSHVSSAQKRVARLDKVMYDIQRHRKLDELELQKSSHTTMSSPTPKTNNSSDYK
ncbi:PAXIP1-associated protein 1, partial [Stegodyphus mimosarum]